ncbi:MAG TPA: cytochrome P450 [Streptosporangiaceae bacterium]|jgi:cytochrome P450|nr:cytochrome P450 [Streptosporangiaceae bacterium]
MTPQLLRTHPAPEHEILDFPLPPPGTMGPPEEYVWLREDCPVARVRMPLGATAWYVTRYDDVRELMADPRLVRPTINEWPERPGEPADHGPALTTMAELDGPRHTALRRAVAPAFSARAIRKRLPRIRELAEQLLEPFHESGSPGDLVAGFTEPFPLLAMCDLVGIPYEERNAFLPVLDEALSGMVTAKEGRRLTDALREYVAALIGHKRHRPGDDVLTRLVRQCEHGGLTDEDVTAFALSMLTAGFGTSGIFLANSVLTLLSQPRLYDRLRDDRQIMPAAVEELLRYTPVGNGMVILLAVEDIELNGQTIRKGEAVLPVLASANRDESVFTDADRLDLCRVADNHLAFGRGIHNCIGSHLARAELAVGLQALLDRFPRLRPAEGREPAWDDESLMKSPLSLPVSW